ncbi:MAG: YihY/virulence factor BrkB family protein [Acidobacteria bacterium]|nr:YihY/virulence factor BrkB family protein [Acidobacteriota bacterium]
MSQPLNQPRQPRLRRLRRLRRRAQQSESPSPLLPSASSPRPSPSLIAREVYQRLFEDDVFGRAAQLAYYWLFSVFPMLIFLTALLAYIQKPALFDNLFEYLNTVLPRDAYSLLRTTFNQIVRRPRSGLLSFGIALTIWAASAGMESLINSLNVAYDVPRGRGWAKDKWRSIWMTLGLAVFVSTALILLFFGGVIGNQIAAGFGYGALFQTGWEFLRWGVIVGFIFFALELIYYLAPNVKQRWRSTTPGSLFALMSWLLISYGFKHYVARFGNYNATYGTLGGLMILMIWLYLTGVAILIGGELNSVLRGLRHAEPLPQGTSQHKT